MVTLTFFFKMKFRFNKSVLSNNRNSDKTVSFTQPLKQIFSTFTPLLSKTGFFSTAFILPALS